MIKNEAIDYAYGILDSSKSASTTLRALRQKYPKTDDSMIYDIFQEAFEKWQYKEAPKLMASRRSAASRRASRENGKNGGRPKKEEAK